MIDSYRALKPADNKKSSISLAFMEYVEKECIPLEVTLEITLNCNLLCQHCYNFDRSKPVDSVANRNQLSSREIFKIIDEIYNEGCLNITFTGGEVLIHPQFYEFATYARKKHMGVYAKTNGLLLTPENVAKLKEAKVMGLEVSFYGASALTHDKLTRAPGSFVKTLRGVKNTQKAGIQTKMNFVLTRHNAVETGAMIALANETGLDYGINPQISARYDGTTSSLKNQMTREQLYNLYSGSLKSHLPQPDFNPEASVQCGCAKGICGISATGEVYPCIGAPVPSGNLRKKSFREIWRNSEVLNNIRGLKLKDFKTCKPCPHRPYCRRSSGMVYVNTGNYTGPESWTCMEAEVIHEVCGNRESSQNSQACGNEFRTFQTKVTPIV